MKLLIGLLLIIVCSSYDWNEVTHFKYFGSINPKEKSGAKYVLGDLNKLVPLLNKAKSSEAYFPKGAQRYAKIKFKSKYEIVIQLLAGRPVIFRVVKRSLLIDKWYELDSKSTLEWEKIMNELHEKLQKS